MRDGFAKWEIKNSVFSRGKPQAGNCWVNYFAVGHSSRCFSFVRDWVEKKMRRHLMRARQRRGFGWRRWSKQWLYEGLGLFDGYRVRRYEPRLKASPT